MKRDALILALITGAAVLWLALRTMSGATDDGGFSGTALLGSAPDDFRRVTGPVPLEFPADHAVHPGYRNEWWYFTGNLEDAQGRRYGFQFTLFRFALDPASRRIDAETESDFDADAVWMAHLAVSDLDQARFFSAERFARGALDLAGATDREWWLRDWRVVRNGRQWRLEAGFDQTRLALALEPVKPVVLQGEAGYSRKGPEPGNASRYYSITRIAVDGALTLDGRPRHVSGQAWLDREWGSSQLGEGVVGWDWFALQLNDGRDLMLYRLRDARGRATPYSAGVLVDDHGRAKVLGRDDFELEPEQWWHDEQGVRWPVAWRARVPSADLDLNVAAAFEDQRWRGSVAYWEGAVLVRPSADRGRIIGRGYLELSGYADRAAGFDDPRR